MGIKTLCILGTRAEAINMAQNQTLSSLASKVLEGLSLVFKDFMSNCLIAYGDKTTTRIAFLSAYYHKVLVVNIKARLQTKDIYFSWSEQINRKFTDNIAQLYSAPTKQFKANLIEEVFDVKKAYFTWNTVIDALFNKNNIEKSNAYKFEVSELCQ